MKQHESVGAGWGAELSVSEKCLFWSFLFFCPTDQKPYLCSLCEFVTTDSQTYFTHVDVQHPAASKDTTSPVPSFTSSLDKGTPTGYPNLKSTFIQGLKKSSHGYLSARSSPSDPNVLPVDLCVRAGGIRDLNSLPLDRKSLPSHKCSFCSHSTRYPEVLWMHQTVAHRISGSSSNLAPKWAIRNNSKGSRDGSLASRRRTGPPPVLEGRECQPLPPLTRAQRTRPPISSSEVPKKSRPVSHASSSSSAPCASSTRCSTFTSGSQAGRVPVRPVSSTVKHREDHRPRFGPKGEAYSRGSSLTSSGSLGKNISSHSRSSAPSPISAAASRMSDRYLMPQEGLGFMLSSKHSFSSDYSRAQGFSQQPLSSSHSQGRPSPSKPSTIAQSSAIKQNRGTAKTHGGSVLNSSSPSSSSTSSTSIASDSRKEVKQEPIAATPEMPTDVLSFLKNYSPQELAALYHRWGAANVLMEPTGRDCFSFSPLFCLP